VLVLRKILRCSGTRSCVLKIADGRSHPKKPKRFVSVIMRLLALHAHSSLLFLRNGERLQFPVDNSRFLAGAEQEMPRAGSPTSREYLVLIELIWSGGYCCAVVIFLRTILLTDFPTWTVIGAATR
jgi:hypothetical protein